MVDIWLKYHILSRMKLEVTGSYCGSHADQLKWPKPFIGWATNAVCWACQKQAAMTYVVGFGDIRQKARYGELVIEKGRFYFNESIFPELNNSKKIFIIGCQRSGTTLLGMMLGAHPAISTYDEPESYAMHPCVCSSLCDTCKWVSRVDATQIDHKTPYSLHKVPMWTHNPTEICTNHPESKLIFLSRDPKEVVSSMFCLKMASGNWIQEQAPREIANMLTKLHQIDPECAEKYTNVYQKLDQEILIGAFCWLLKENFTKYCTDLPIIRVNYTDLVTDPTKTMHTVTDFLEIDWDESVLQHHMTNFGLKIGHTQGDRSIDTASLQKYQKVLTKSQQKQIEAFVSQHQT
jgi:hypothetical protein